MPIDYQSPRFSVYKIQRSRSASRNPTKHLMHVHLPHDAPKMVTKLNWRASAQ